jgi:hypothetical protein
MRLIMLVLSLLIAGAAAAQQEKSPPSLSPGTPVPPTPDNRSGLPAAPPDIVPPGSAARPYTGNDQTQPKTTIVPKSPSATPPAK